MYRGALEWLRRLRILQVVEELLDSAEDQTKMTLLYCSQVVA
jgi:hypothetical protein